jgi:hypothetical protein
MGLRWAQGESHQAIDAIDDVWSCTDRHVIELSYDGLSCVDACFTWREVAIEPLQKWRPVGGLSVPQVLEDFLDQVRLLQLKTFRRTRNLPSTHAADTFVPLDF